AASAAYDLTTAAQGSMPLNGVRISVERDVSPGAPTDSYVIHAAVDGLSWRPHLNGSSSASVYVMAVSLDTKNKMLGHTLHGMIANAKPGTDLRDAARTADFHFAAPPAPR